MSDKIREALEEIAEYPSLDASEMQRIARAALAQQPAPVAVPDGWRDVIENVRESIWAGALQENANTERLYVEPYLDGIYDELEALEKESAAPPAPVAVQEPSEEAAYQIGAKGAEPTEAERLLFEAYMRGHCWAVAGEWNGKTYVSPVETGGVIDPAAMMTRQLWAAWRDRAALACHAAQPAAEQPACVSDSAESETQSGLTAADETQAAEQPNAAVMPCGTAVSNVYEAYEAGKKAAEQPDTVKVPRELLRMAWRLIPSAEGMSEDQQAEHAAWHVAASALLAGGDKP